MPFGNSLVHIEFTKDADHKTGTRMRVDAGSATSLCDIQKVAKRVSADAAPVTPEPVEAVADVEPVAIPAGQR